MVQFTLCSHQFVPNIADLNESFSENNSSIIKPPRKVSPLKCSVDSPLNSTMNFIWFVRHQENDSQKKTKVQTRRCRKLSRLLHKND